MNWIDLGNPIPRATNLVYSPFHWEVGELIYLPTPSEENFPPLNIILDRRRTHREFKPIKLEDLSKWLWYVGRECGMGHSRYGFPLSRRPVPSAGAIHPVNIVFSLPDHEGWQLYIPGQHAFASLILNTSITEAGVESLYPVIDVQLGSIVRLIAEPQKTAAKYEDSCSLIWRDAGVLLGQMAVVAEALNLNFCPLGITGDDWCELLDKKRSLVGVGLAVIGSRR